MPGPFSSDFEAGFGNGAFFAGGRVVARGLATPQFSVGSNPVQAHASGLVGLRGSATVAPLVVSVAAFGRVTIRSEAGAASQFTLGVQGAIRTRGIISGQVIAQVSVRGSIGLRGSAQRSPTLSIRGFARLSGGATAAVFSGGASPFTAAFSADFGSETIALPVTVAAHGRISLRGTATRAFGLIAVRGFVVTRGRATPSVRAASLAARGRVVMRGTAHDTIQAQQVVVDGAPPPLTIWQRLATVTPSHSLQEKPRVMRNTFGDGYGQTVPDGLTPIVRTLTLSWENLDKTEADQIVQFLKDSIGQPISFAAPRELAPRNWIAMDWRRTSPQPNADNLTVTFEDRPFRELILGL